MTDKSIEDLDYLETWLKDYDAKSTSKPEDEPTQPVENTDEEELAEATEGTQKSVEKPVVSSGAIILRYKRMVVKRDDEGRIVELLGDGVRKSIVRDEHGRVLEILEEEETEE